jgi:Myotubularin-like phosphatase domain
MILVEKDFLSFGHMFAQRSGHLSNEKFFIDKFQPTTSDSPPHSGRSSPSIGPIPPNIVHSSPSAASAARGAFSNMASKISFMPGSNSKTPQMRETSPTFHQFLDAVYQILYTHPQRFEFTERFLRRLLYHAYSCQYGSFLYDCERERVENKVRKRTRCVWDYFLARRNEFINPEFDPALDEREGVLFPKGENVRWWAQVWGRADGEMNGLGRVYGREEGREDIQDRLSRIMKSASPRLEEGQFDGVGGSPADGASKENSPTRNERPQVVQGDVSTEEIDTTMEASTVFVDKPNVAVLDSTEETQLDGHGIDLDLRESTLGLQNLELDPLGGGIEMTSLVVKGTSLGSK